jgi:hypothetical protein
MFDIGSLVSTLGNSLANPDDSIEATDFIEKTPRRSPFLHKIDDWEISSTTKCNLIWTAHGRGLMAIAGIPKEVNLGYAFLEEGYVDASSDYCGYYESLRLRLKHSLELKNGLTIPPCSIKITHEAHECEAGDTIRRDHIRRLGLFWQRTDLSSLLPTGWFFHRPEYAAQESRAYGSALGALPAQ